MTSFEISHLESLIKEARSVAFLAAHVGDRADGKEMLQTHLERLHRAVTAYDNSEEPDLTFCCGCRELLEGDPWVVDGAKYHQQCVPRS